MPTETTYAQAQANLSALCDEVTSTREPIVIHRRGSEDVALMPAAELASLMETAHLLRSPRNCASPLDGPDSQPGAAPFRRDGGGLAPGV